MNWLTEDSREFLSRGYLLPGVTPEQRIRDIANHAESLLPGMVGFADKFYDYMSRGWYSLSSPVWSNFGLKRGLPVSCFGSWVPDSMDGILTSASEIGMMSKYGGGTSAYFGEVRGRGSPITDNGNSEGSVHFMKLFDAVVDASRQGASRRGSMAAYLPIDHPDIYEFLEIKDAGNPIQNLYFGVTVTDEWMNSMVDGDNEKRKVWAKVLQSRNEKGVPYIFFYDNVNNNKPEVYESMPIVSSNLCAEINLPSNELESFVCCLSSMNILHYDEWRDTDAVELLTYFLDAVMTEFINRSKDIPYFERANRFAVRHRALGLGVLGWHSYLQSRMIPFESLQATMLNNEIFKNIRTSAYKASEALANLYGEPEVLEGVGRRNTTLLAVAPTTSSAFILGQVSQSIEPLRSNYYTKNLAKSLSTYRNPYLKKLLAEKNQDTEETWRSILENDGSVQHLDFLDEHEKNVFKTFPEISQLDVIIQAANRQRYIDQGQSLNIMIHPDTPVKDVNKLHLEAWRRGIKSLYYQHSISASQAFNRELLNCSSCEG